MNGSANFAGPLGPGAARVVGRADHRASRCSDQPALNANLTTPWPPGQRSRKIRGTVARLARWQASGHRVFAGVQSLHPRRLGPSVRWSRRRGGTGRVGVSRSEPRAFVADGKVRGWKLSTPVRPAVFRSSVHHGLRTVGENFPDRQGRRACRAVRGGAIRFHRSTWGLRVRGEPSGQDDTVCRCRPRTTSIYIWY